MKIQSRPQVDTALFMTGSDVAAVLRTMLEIEGAATSDMYRKVLTIGAVAVLKEQGFIMQSSVCIGGRGYYGVSVDIEMPSGEYVHLAL